MTIDYGDETSSLIKIYHRKQVYYCDYIGSTHQPDQLCFNKSCYNGQFSYFPGVGWVGGCVGGVKLRFKTS